MDKRTTEVKLSFVFHLVFEQMILLYIYKKNSGLDFDPTLRIDGAKKRIETIRQR